VSVLRRGEADFLKLSLVVLHTILQVDVLDAKARARTILVQPDFRDVRIGQKSERREARDELIREQKATDVRGLFVPVVPGVRELKVYVQRSLDDRLTVGGHVAKDAIDVLVPLSREQEIPKGSNPFMFSILFMAYLRWWSEPPKRARADLRAQRELARRRSIVFNPLRKRLINLLLRHRENATSFTFLQEVTDRIIYRQLFAFDRNHEHRSGWAVDTVIRIRRIVLRSVAVIAGILNHDAIPFSLCM